MQPKIQFEKVTKTYVRRNSHVEAVAEFNFQVHENEVLVLVGPSGCGKSTILHMAAGLIPPTSGKVLMDGREIKEPGPDRAVVFQQFALFPWKTVYQNIEFGLKFNGASEKEKKELVEKYIARMGLKGFENAYPHELSGGMKQRVAIARSFVVNPDVLLLDEPFAALDAQTRTIMQEELGEQLKLEKHTVIFITHSVDEAIYLGDRIVVLTQRPARVKEVIDLKGTDFMPERREESMNDVMASEKFAKLRNEIWGMVRSEIVFGRREGVS